jgi:hypothetical protein
LGSRRPRHNYRTGMPSFMHLFTLFWPYDLLLKIVRKSNDYATEKDEVGNSIGGPS